mgnify:CR=1 FL=1
MIEHCMVDGKRCSKCCEVILLNKKSFSYAWREYARRYMNKGLADLDECEKLLGGKESMQVLMMIRPIKRRIAKKRNPHLYKSNPQWGRMSQAFVCSHLTENGCGDYENRPNMCSAYPHYGKTLEEWKKH